MGIETGVGRLGSLQDPWNAGASRFVIWQSSWAMLQDAPWHGLGAGIYGLAYPPYRLATDKSAGHFAHNDLLQLAIELGWPGVMLCVMAVLALFVMVWNRLGQSALSDRHMHEAVLLSAGLFAVFTHSFFTFNFYVYSTLLVVGILTARICHLLLPSAVGVVLIDLRKYGAIIAAAPSALCLVPIFVLISGGLSQIATEKAIAELEQGQSRQVFEYLGIAKRFWPANDFNWYMEGEVLRLALADDFQGSVEERQRMFSQAEQSFIRAFELNPLRAMTPHRLGLLRSRSGSEKKGGAAEIADLYQHALNIDPSYFPARLDLAESYARRGNPELAMETLEGGVRHHYQDLPEVIPLFERASRYRVLAGDLAGAAELDQRIQQIRAKWQGKG